MTLSLAWAGRIFQNVAKPGNAIFRDARNGQLTTAAFAVQNTVSHTDDSISH